MRTTLICRLHTNQQEISWILLNNNDYFDSNTQIIDQPLPQSPAIVLLPTTAFLLTQITAPSKQRQKINQAVPFLLEEQLIDEIENLHFTIGECDPITRLINVAVISNQQLDDYINFLRLIYPKITTCIPDVFAVPKPSEGWGVLCIENMVLVRTATGFAIEVEQLGFVLQTIAQLPSQLTLFAGAQLDEMEQTVLTTLYGLGIPVKVEHHPQDKLAWWQQGINRESKLFNVLQGSYRPVHKTTLLWKPWRLTAVLLIILTIIFMIKQLVTVEQLEKQRQQLNMQIETVYKETFPQARKVVNPKVQMEQQLNALRANSGQSGQTHDFLTLLNTFSPFLSQLPNLQIKHLDYLDNSFDITLETSQLQSLDQLKQSLQTVNLQLAVQTATSRNNIVEARIRITTF